MSWKREELVSVAMDIETVRLPVSDEARARFEKEYVPEGYKVPRNIKDAVKLEAHREAFVAGEGDRKAKAFADFEEKDAFRLHRNRMISLSLGTIGDSDVSDIEAFYGDDPAKILAGALGYLEAVGAFRFVGWNCNKFDLPILAKHMGTYGLRLPRRQGKWDTVDLCQYPFAYTSLKDCARAFGLNVPPVDGSDVAGLYARQAWTDIAEYNKSDVRLTGRLYLLASNVWEL